MPVVTFPTPSVPSYSPPRFEGEIECDSGSRWPSWPSYSRWSRQQELPWPTKATRSRAKPKSFPRSTNALPPRTPMRRPISRSMSCRCWAVSAATVAPVTARFKEPANSVSRCSATTSKPTMNRWAKSFAVGSIPMTRWRASFGPNPVPTTPTPTKGASRYDVNSWQGRVIRSWLEGGARVRQRVDRQA